METILVIIHVGSVLISYVAAYFVFIKPKGGKDHKLIGKTYAIFMLIASFSSLGIYKATGGINIFHFLALVTISSILAGCQSIIKYKKSSEPKWLVKHYFNMTYSFMGLNLAALAQASRGLDFDTSMQHIIFNVIMYIPAVLFARWLIRVKLIPNMIKSHIS